MSGVCRVCLHGNVKLYDIKNGQLQVLYTSLARTKLNEVVGATICNLCYSQLQRILKFSELAQQSIKKVRDLEDRGIQISQETIECYFLGTPQNLTITTIPPISINGNSKSTHETVKIEHIETEDGTNVADCETLNDNFMVNPSLVNSPSASISPTFFLEQTETFPFTVNNPFLCNTALTCGKEIIEVEELSTALNKTIRNIDPASDSELFIKTLRIIPKPGHPLGKMNLRVDSASSPVVYKDNNVYKRTEPVTGRPGKSRIIKNKKKAPKHILRKRKVVHTNASKSQRARAPKAPHQTSNTQVSSIPVDTINASKKEEEIDINPSINKNTTEALKPSVRKRKLFHIKATITNTKNAPKPILQKGKVVQIKASEPQTSSAPKVPHQTINTQILSTVVAAINESKEEEIDINPRISKNTRGAPKPSFQKGKGVHIKAIITKKSKNVPMPILQKGKVVQIKASEPQTLSAPKAPHQTINSQISSTAFASINESKEEEEIDISSLSNDQREKKIKETIQKLTDVIVEKSKPTMLALQNPKCHSINEYDKINKHAKMSLRKKRFPLCSRSKYLLAHLVKLAGSQHAGPWL